jgi:hypothetical protein
MDDAMDCFCPRCHQCGGLEYDPYGGEECVCEMGEGWRFCRNCGCSDERACEGGCWWIAADLCSECAPVAVVEVKAPVL